MKLLVQLGVLSAVNIFLAFLTQWYVVAVLGPGLQTDALFAGMTIPQLVLTVISGSLMHVLVPLLSGESEDRFRHDSWGFFTLIGGMFAFLGLILAAVAPLWVPWTVPGFSANGRALTVTIARIYLLGMVFTALNGVQWAVYHAKQQFLWAEIAPIVSAALALLLLVWALPRYGVIAAAWIGVLRLALQTLLLMSGMGRPVRPDMKSPSLKDAWHRIRPLLLGTAYYKTDPVIDRMLLSTATGGSLSLFYLAQQIYSAAVQVLNKSVAAPLVPALSLLYKSGNSIGFRQRTRKAALQTALIGFICLLALGLVGQSVLQVVAVHGRFDAAHVRTLWWILLWLAGMFMGGTVGQIASSAFYATGDTTTPTRMSIITYTLYIPGKIISFLYGGVAGLAIATSIYYLTNLSLLIYLMLRKSIA